jgi:hypothetical protein
MVTSSKWPDEPSRDGGKPATFQKLFSLNFVYSWIALLKNCFTVVPFCYHLFCKNDAHKIPVRELFCYKLGIYLIVFDLISRIEALRHNDGLRISLNAAMMV